MNLRPSKLCRVYVGDFFWSWILKGFIHVQIEKGKFCLSMATSCSGRQCTKKRHARAEQLFAHKTNCFLSLLLLMLSSSLLIACAQTKLLWLTPSNQSLVIVCTQATLLKVPIKNVKEISSASVEEHNKQTPRLRKYFGQISKNHSPLFPPWTQLFYYYF